MVTKYLQWRLLLENSDDSGMSRALELEYYLIESELDYKGELYGKKVYGIGVVKKVDSMRFEEKVINDFSCCMEKTRQVINRLASNSVTPVGLQPVLEDIVAL